MKTPSNAWMYVALLSLTGAVASCTPEARTALATNGLEVGLCVAQNQDLPVEQVIAKCITENVTADDITRILAEQKKATARAAAKRLSCDQTDAGKP